MSDVNTPPVVLAGLTDLAAAEDTLFTAILPADAFADADPDDALALAATLEDGTALPSWLAFDTATSAFAGTPENPDVGTLTIRVTATDGAGASVFDDFVLTVANTNDVPVLVAPLEDQSATEDAPFVFTLDAGAFADPDAGDAVTLSAALPDDTPLPAWLIFDAATATFTGTPDNADVGALTIRVTATDLAGASVFDNFTIDIANTNDAPILVAPLGDQESTEDAPFIVTLPADMFVDLDPGDTLALSARLADGAPLPAWLSFDAATGTFTGTPDNADVGTAIVSVTATDLAGASVSDDFTLTIANTNDAPTVAAPLGDQTATEDAPLTLTLPSDSFADVDPGDALTLSATRADGAALPSWLTFDATTGTFTGTPENADVGPLELRVTATDLAGASVSDDFVLTVANTNDAPTVAAPVADQAATGGTPFAFTLPAGTFADPDAGDGLTLAATGADGTPLPDWLSFDATTATFTGTPPAAAPSFIAIDVTATDQASAAVAERFVITIAEPGTTVLLVDGSQSFGGYPTIGLALDAASAIRGPITILIADGTYTEQVTIDRDDITLRGQSRDGVVLRAPATPTVQGTHAPWGPNGDVAAIVAVRDAANVTLENLTIDGDNRVDEAFAAGADAFFGVLYLRSSGAVDAVTIEAIRGGGGALGLRGGQGVGVLADYDPADPNPTTSRQQFSLTDSFIGDFQKAGLLAYNTDITLTGNRFEGLGQTAAITQNAIQLSRNTTGTVTGNSFESLGYNGASTGFDDAAAIVVTDSAGGLVITDNDFIGSTATDDTAIFLLDSAGVVVTANRFDRWFTAVTDLDDTAYGRDFTPGALNTITGNTLGAIGIALRFNPGLGAPDGFTHAGSTGDDLLFGSGASDTLGGGIGQDTLAGRVGDDTYLLGADQTVREGVDRGRDHILASVDVLDLAANVELLTLLGSVRQGSGNSHANVITGNAAANQLQGFEGADSLVGGGGDDLLEGGEDADTLDGGAGIDTLKGGNGDDTYLVDNRQDSATDGAFTGRDTVIASVTYSIAARAGIDDLALTGTAKTGTGNDLANTLTGNALGNTLLGGAGADTLLGGAGRDTLEGGSGADVFRFATLADSGAAPPAADLIRDVAAGDRIDVAAIDANPGLAGDQAFAYVGTAAFTAIGQLRHRYDQTRGETIVELNTAAGTAPEMVIRIAGQVALTADAFLL